MKILWQVSFRPFNKSATNNKVQNHFIDNLIKFNPQSFLVLITSTATIPRDLANEEVFLELII